MFANKTELKGKVKCKPAVELRVKLILNLILSKSIFYVLMKKVWYYVDMNMNMLATCIHH